MCENPEGTYTWTEYDRQFHAVTGTDTGILTGMRIMPILLRYVTGPSLRLPEWSWAGDVPTGGSCSSRLPLP